MIERLQIADFQIHERRVVEFDRVTTLVGDSGTGKSGLIRCLRWLMVNKPTGDSFVRKGAEQAKATLTVDGRKVTRAKGKGVNRYRYQGEDYKAFGAGAVPDPIAAHFNVSDASFQSQHSPVFLFSLSAGQVSQALNAVVNLGEIDETQAAMASELRKARAAVVASEERLADAQAKVEGSRWAVEADADLKGLEEREERCRSLRLRSLRLSDLILEGENLGERADHAKSDALEAGKAVKELEKVRKRMETLQKRAETLKRLIERLGEAEDGLCRASEEAERAEKELAKLTAKKCPLCGR